MCESCYVGDSLIDVIETRELNVVGVEVWGSSFRAIEYELGRPLEGSDFSYEQ